jgi:hypothetical protein
MRLVLNYSISNNYCWTTRRIPVSRENYTYLV